MSEEIHEVGQIGNCYGGLSIKKAGDKYFWSILDYDDGHWFEIHKTLYDELLKEKREEEI